MAAQQAAERLVWFDRGRADRVQWGEPKRRKNAQDAGLLALRAYDEGWSEEHSPLAVHKSRIPAPLRAGSAEVRVA